MPATVVFAVARPGGLRRAVRCDTRGVVRGAVVAVGLVLALLVGSACGDDDSAGPAVGTVTTATTTPTTTGEAPPDFTASVDVVYGRGPVRVLAIRAARSPVEDLAAWSTCATGASTARSTKGRIVLAADVVDAVLGVLRRAVRRPLPDRADGAGRRLWRERRGVHGRQQHVSAFNCRQATGGSGWSEHAYGRAIDLNPLQNPYVRGDTVLPAAVRPLHRPGPHRHGHDPRRRRGRHRVRQPIGWEWGGEWQTLKDYQHFSRSGR